MNLTYLWEISTDIKILYFGVNLILMHDYRLAFDVEIKISDNQIEVLIIGQKSV